MIEFKFPCPKCGQRIAATDQHTGLQLNCPGCQAPLTVPAPPGSPGQPAPPAPPPKASLGVSALSNPHPAPAGESHPAASFLPPPSPVRRKKSYTNVIVGISVTVVVAVAVAAIIFGPKAISKWKESHGDASAADAGTNKPAPPPPQLDGSEILLKMAETYKALPSFRAQGKSTTSIELPPATATAAPLPPQTLTADVAIKLGRPDNMRIDFDRQGSPVPAKINVWSAGKGNFIMNNDGKPARLADRLTAINRLNTSALGATIVARLFFGDPIEAGSGADWTKTNNAKLEGQSCYVLTAKVNNARVLLWVDQTTFLIPQIQVILGGPVDEAEMTDEKLKEALILSGEKAPVSAAKIAQTRATLKAASKIKGSITDIFQNIDTNAMALTEFEPVIPAATAAPATPRVGRPAPPAGAPGRRRPGG